MTALPGEWRAAWIAFGGGLALRVLGAGWSGGLSHDAAAYYLPNARALAEGGLGNWDGMTIAVPPLFPTLVALVGRITGDLEIAALCISVVAGAALVFPVAGLAARIAPGRPLARRIAIAFAAVHPYLVRFSGDARADSLYVLSFATAVLLGIATLDGPRLARGAAFGLVVGVAYLLRPEALGLPVLLGAAVVVRAWRSLGTPEWAPWARSVLAAGAGGSLLLLPALAWNVAFVHHKLGLFTLSPKAGILLDYDKVGMGDPFSPLNADKTMTLYEEKLTRPNAYQSFGIREAFREHPRSMLLSVLENIGQFYAYFGPAMGALPAIALLAGVVFAARDAGARRRLWLVLAVILFYTLALCIFYVSKRFWLPLIPLLLPWSGAGMAGLWRRVRGERPFAAWAWIATLLLVLVQTVHKWPENDWWQSPERSLGARLEARFGPGEVYVSRKGIVTWHARGHHVWLPTGAPLSDIAAYLSHRNARLVILEGGSRERELPPAWAELRASPAFREIDRIGEGLAEILVYERL